MLFKSIATIGLGLTLSSTAFSATECAKDKNGWKDQKQFEQSLKDQGYKIKVFKVTKGNCYEIYGWNKEGKKVEIYFHPVTGDIVKSEIGK